VLHVIFCEAPQNRFRVRGPQSQRRGELDEFFVLLFDDFPINRPSQDRLKIGVLIQISLLRPVEPLFFEVFQARQKFKAQQMAECRSGMGLHLVAVVRRKTPGPTGSRGNRSARSRTENREAIYKPKSINRSL
jgi:hypothetical protein